MASTIADTILNLPEAIEQILDDEDMFKEMNRKIDNLIQDRNANPFKRQLGAMIGEQLKAAYHNRHDREQPPGFTFGTVCYFGEQDHIGDHIIHARVVNADRDNVCCVDSSGSTRFVPRDHCFSDRESVKF